MSKKIEDFEVGDEFMVDGLSQNGDFIKSKAKLIGYNGMNKYIIDNEGITILVEGDDNAYEI
jgi:rRNA processing protein Krr1/Pno1